MGKRKHFEATYYQCDWTGYLMPNSNCYMPMWHDTKLVKKGHYCNWESVVAHIDEVAEKKGDEETTRWQEAARAHIDALIGAHVEPAPHWSALDHFHRAAPTANSNVKWDTEKITSPAEFQRLCESREMVSAVMMPINEPPSEVEVDPKTLASMRCFTSVSRSLKTGEITVCTFADALEPNIEATKLFKLQVYGPVYLLLKSTESCFLPRTRYINFSLSHFFAVYAKAVKSKKKQDDVEEVVADIQQELDQVEDRQKKLAKRPTATKRQVPPPNGKLLGALTTQLGPKPTEPVGA